MPAIKFHLYDHQLYHARNVEQNVLKVGTEGDCS